MCWMLPYGLIPYVLIVNPAQGIPPRDFPEGFHLVALESRRPPGLTECSLYRIIFAKLLECSAVHAVDVRRDPPIGQHASADDEGCSNHAADEADVENLLVRYVEEEAHDAHGTPVEPVHHQSCATDDGNNGAVLSSPREGLLHSAEGWWASWCRAQRPHLTRCTRCAQPRSALERKLRHRT